MEEFLIRLNVPVNDAEQGVKTAVITDAQWKNGIIVHMNEAFIGPSNNLLKGDIVLVEKELAERFVAVNYARFVDDDEDKELRAEFSTKQPAKKATKKSAKE